jgi:hypothetical protein
MRERVLTINVYDEDNRILGILPSDIDFIPSIGEFISFKGGHYRVVRIVHYFKDYEQLITMHTKRTNPE